MLDWLQQGSNSKTFLLILFFVTFIGILLYLYTNRKRSQRLESYKNIPFEDDDVSHHKENENE